MTQELFPTETQSELSFPVSLVEKYRPREIDGFVGLPKPKAVFKALLRKPRACALLLVGPPGVGKTTMALAFANQLKAGLVHIPSQGLTVDAVESTWERIHYYPESGGFWVVICDEADRMSRQAQVALLSKLDAAASLKPTFGGRCAEGKPLPVIWIFTCNGEGAFGTDPPDAFEKRFLSRCLKIPFETYNLDGELTDYLRMVWEFEKVAAETAPDFETLTHKANGSVRDALQALELEILSARAESMPSPKVARPTEATQDAASEPVTVDAKQFIKDAIAHVQRLHWAKQIDFWTASEAQTLLESLNPGA